MRLFRGGRANRSSDAHERAQLAMLHETALGLIERLDLQELLEAIAERAGDLVGAGNGPLFDEHGRPVQQRGVTAVPRLYFVGLHWLHKRKSSLLFGVGEDAELVVAHIAGAD